MPTVPTYQGPQVRMQALQAVPQQGARSDAAFGGVAGRQMADLGGALGSLGTAHDGIQEREDQTKAFKAEAAITESWMKWDSDARTKYRGENVGDYVPNADAWWKKAASETASGLSPRAQSLIDRSLGARRLQAMQSVGAFVNSERERHADDAYAADVEASIRFGLSTGTPDSTVLQVRDKIAAVAVRKGWTIEQMQSEMIRTLSPLHVGIMREMMQSGNSGAATAYFEKYKGGLTDQAKATMLGAVKESSENTLAESAASQAWGALGPRILNDPVKLFDMEEHIRSALKGNPDAMNKAVSSLRQRAQAFNAQQAEVKAASVSQVWGLIDSGKSLPTVMRSDAWLGLTDKDRRDIRRDMEAEAATRASRQAAEASRDYTALQRNEHLQLLRNGDQYLTASDPEVLSKMSRAQVEALRGRFGLEATKQLLTKHEALSKPGKLIEAKMDKQDFDTVADSLGLKPYAPKSESESRKLGQLQYRVEQLIDRRQSEEKRPLTRQEKAELMRQEMARTVVVDGFWSDSTVPVIQLSAEQVSKVIVPSGERAKVAQALQEMYRRDPTNPDYAPTEDNVRRTYLRAQSRSAELIGQ